MIYAIVKKDFFLVEYRSKRRWTPCDIAPALGIYVSNCMCIFSLKHLIMCL